MGRAGRPKGGGAGSELRGTQASASDTFEGFVDTVGRNYFEKNYKSLVAAKRSGVISEEDLRMFSWRVDEKVIYATEEYDIETIADIAERIYPRFNRQEFLEAAEERYRKANHMGYLDWSYNGGHIIYIEKELDKMTDEQKRELYNNSDLRRGSHETFEEHINRILMDDDVVEAIAANPGNNEYVRIDALDHGEWLAERHKEVIAGALRDTVRSGAMVEDEEFFDKNRLLLLGQQSTEGPSGRDIKNFSSADSDTVFLDKEGAAIGNKRNYETSLAGQDRKVHVVEKRNDDGRAIRVSTGEEGNEVFVAISQSASDPKLVRAVDQDGQELEVTLDEQSGSMETWAVNQLEQELEKRRHVADADAKDPNKQADRLLQDLV